MNRDKTGMLELDFESDPEDIRNSNTHDDEVKKSSQPQSEVFDYRQSLRVGPLLPPFGFISAVLCCSPI